MKTKYKFIEFVEVVKPPLCGWVCVNNTHKDRLGYCEYYKSWKQWTFNAFETAAFSHDCLLDIADFLRQLNEADGIKSK